MNRPSFIGIGAQKCATTWIYDVLRDHPQVGLSACKELDFFSHHFDRGFHWYERQFAEAAGAPAVGEISPSYFHDAAAPARARAALPDARVILSLRDPVERAISHHRHAVRVGDLTGEDLRFELGLATNPMYLEQGRYATHLERWLAEFPRERVLVLFFEDIVRDPGAAAAQVYRFLGVNDGHRSASLGERSNASHVTPHAALEYARRTLRLTACRAGLGGVWGGAARLGARGLYRRLNRRPSEEAIAPVSPETLRALRAHFRVEIQNLQRLTGRDLAPWLQG